MVATSSRLPWRCFKGQRWAWNYSGLQPERSFLSTKSDSFQLMVCCWFGARWFGFLGSPSERDPGSPSERDCYLGRIQQLTIGWSLEILRLGSDTPGLKLRHLYMLNMEVFHESTSGLLWWLNDPFIFMCFYKHLKVKWPFAWQFCWWPFLGWWKRCPFKGCWWSPTRGSKGHGLNHLWSNFIATSHGSRFPPNGGGLVREITGYFRNIQVGEILWTIWPDKMGVSKNNGKTSQIIPCFLGVFHEIFTIHFGVP